LPVTAVIGAQWGDEGKGKIVDLLAGEADIVARSAGGSNAGHTIVNAHGTFKLHSMPSGAFNPNALNVLGTGTVVDFDSLIKEISEIMAAGVPEPRFVVSDRAHVVMPFHKELDQVKDWALGDLRLGTTGQGVGPAYSDKIDRIGIQTGELLDMEALLPRLKLLLKIANQTLHKIYGGPEMELEHVLEKVNLWRERFGERIQSTVPVLRDALHTDKRILLEGQLGVMRDLDWGTYPYVTSSTTFAAGAGAGVGIPPRSIQDIVGVVKAYTTAVGEGPVPTELHGKQAADLRNRGNEFGATTGRPRRIGWLDAVALRYAVSVGAFTQLAITKLDILGGIDPIKIAVGYEIDGEIVDEFPHSTALRHVRPVYETVPGWPAQIECPQEWADLPENARKYVRRVEELAGVRVSMIGVGESREAIIRL
jgi:adenylosuccinate synthase